MTRVGATAILLPLIALAWTLTAASAQEPADRDLALLGEPEGIPLSGIELEMATHDVASRMRCPVCQGLSVADSHVESAQAMREKARDLLAAGYSDDQVLRYFESSYGEFIRLSPRPEGFNLVVWLLPVGGILVGALVIWSRLRRRGASTVETPMETDDDLAAYRERVRREVGAGAVGGEPGEVGE